MARRKQVITVPIAGGRTITVILRDSVVVEDAYLSLVRARLFAIQTGEPFSHNLTSRKIKDVLIRNNITL